MHNLFSHINPINLTTGIAQNSTDHEFAAQDMRGYEGVAYLAVLDSAHATGTGTQNIHVELSATSSADGTWTDADYSAAYATSGWSGTRYGLITDCYRPKYRWTRLVVDRISTEVLIASAWAFQYRPLLTATSFSTDNLIPDVQICLGSTGTATGSS